MDNLKFYLRQLSFLIVLSAFTGCDSAAGRDSILSEDSRHCTYCHGSGNAVDPLGSDQDKHDLHVKEENLACEDCHFEYFNTPTHNDGNSDKGNTLTNHVNFDSTNNPDGIWNSAITSCSSIDCHGEDKTEVFSWLDD